MDGSGEHPADDLHHDDLHHDDLHHDDLREEYVRDVRTLGAGPRGAVRHVVIVPGMGALGYLTPTVRALAEAGAAVTLLDLPGFGRRDGVGCGPTVHDVASTAARWCRGLPAGERLVLVGHSTGALSALLAALQLEEEGHRPAAVVLAGPVPAPNQRSLPRVLDRVPLAYRREALGELAVLGDYRRAGRDALKLLRSALAERPERAVRRLRAPLLVTAGRTDAFAPPGWLVALAHAAASRLARVERLPGSHNNPYTHPAAVASAILRLADQADQADQPGGRRRRHRHGPLATSR